MADVATAISPDRAAELRAVISNACAEVGFVSDGAELIKYTVNAVFRLQHTPVVVRVGTGTVGRLRGHRLVSVARLLADQGAPTAPLARVPQPIAVGEHTVTFWRELGERSWAPEDLAIPLKQLHSAVPSDGLPGWDPFGHAFARLDEADDALCRGDRQWLRDQWAAAEEEYCRWQSEIPLGVIHGDPHAGNLLADEAGRIVMCDLDETGVGPLAWDLVPQAVGAIRFARADYYRRFVAAYGTDVTTEPYWSVLRRIRELIMVTSVLTDLGKRPEVAAEHAHRIASLRAGDANAIWHRYQ